MYEHNCLISIDIIFSILYETSFESWQHNVYLSISEKEININILAVSIKYKEKRRSKEASSAAIKIATKYVFTLT